MTLSVLEDLAPDLAMMARLVQSQLMNAMTAFFQRDPVEARRVMDKDDQIVDERFDTRPVLSQARSLLTSSRLVTDPEFARFIYLKGVEWLEQAVDLAATAAA